MLVMSSEVETSLILRQWKRSRDLIRLLPARLAFGLPVYLAASPAARFLHFGRKDKVLRLSFKQ